MTSIIIELFTQGGLLKTYKPGDPEGPKTLLPQETDKHECEIEQRKQETENRKCFLAGKINLFISYDSCLKHNTDFSFLQVTLGPMNNLDLQLFTLSG